MCVDFKGTLHINIDLEKNCVRRQIVVTCKL